MTSGDLLTRFQGMRALVVGDLMLDAYIFGHAERISPEAPVMVIRKERESFVPGGAANVARNLTALGAEVSVVGIVGSDDAGERLKNQLGVAGTGIVVDPSRPTTMKTRVVADHSHQVLRIDEESSLDANAPIEAKLIEQVAEAIGTADVILLSDYLKGALTTSLVARIIQLAKVPVVANPKPRSVGNYTGATLISLNRLELSQVSGLHTPAHDADAENMAKQALDRYSVKGVMATLGAAGMVAVDQSNVFRVAAERVEVYDTAGAGDTAIATAALGLAAVGFRKEVFELAARTSAAVVRHVGVVVPDESDLAAIRAT